ncbi:uncharacterized protein LOC141903094 [Tubulanus polymorphus]|uniref:uncharacterized protein LOC141903094 n=1 Tax=Tubulanus polymorphus TaxID=672921 RepID=UPI003DA531C9
MIDEASSDGGVIIIIIIGSLASLLGATFTIVVCLCCYKQFKFERFEDEQHQQHSEDVDSPQGTYTVTRNDMTGSLNLNEKVAPAVVVVNEEPRSASILPRDFGQCTLHPRIARSASQNLGTEELSAKEKQFPRSQIQFIKELGSGWFGRVLQAEAQRIVMGMRKSKVAIKMLEPTATQDEQYRFMMDNIPYRELDHQNLMRILGVCTENVPYLIIMEYFPLGDLKAFLLKRKNEINSFNIRGTLLKYSCDLAAGLYCLHQHNFIHHDFALRNCMVSIDMSIKIGDYGISEETYKDDYHFSLGNPIPLRWCAPESIHSNLGQIYMNKIDKKANVWSFGVALWEMVHFGKLPYDNISDSDLIQKILSKERFILPSPVGLVKHKEKLYEVMLTCWTEEPANRKSLSEIHELLKQLKQSQEDADVAAFDKRWEQMMPKEQPTVVTVEPVISNQVIEEMMIKPSVKPRTSIKLTDTNEETIAWGNKDEQKPEVSKSIINPLPDTLQLTVDTQQSEATQLSAAIPPLTQLSAPEETNNALMHPNVISDLYDFEVDNLTSQNQMKNSNELQINQPPRAPSPLMMIPVPTAAFEPITVSPDTEDPPASSSFPQDLLLSGGTTTPYIPTNLPETERTEDELESPSKQTIHFPITYNQSMHNETHTSSQQDSTDALMPSIINSISNSETSQDSPTGKKKVGIGAVTMKFDDWDDDMSLGSPETPPSESHIHQHHHHRHHQHVDPHTTRQAFGERFPNQAMDMKDSEIDVSDAPEEMPHVDPDNHYFTREFTTVIDQDGKSVRKRSSFRKPGKAKLKAVSFDELEEPDVFSYPKESSSESSDGEDDVVDVNAEIEREISDILNEPRFTDDSESAVHSSLNIKGNRNALLLQMGSSTDSEDGSMKKSEL